MTIEKLQGGLRLKIGGVLIGINPQTKFSADFYIFTQQNPEKMNEGKIFDLPGEYEISDIFAFAFGSESFNWLLLNANNLKEKILILEKPTSVPEELEYFFDDSLTVLILKPKPNLIEFLKNIEPGKIILSNASQAEFFKKELACEVEVL